MHRLVAYTIKDDCFDHELLIPSHIPNRIKNQGKRTFHKECLVHRDRSSIGTVTCLACPYGDRTRPGESQSVIGKVGNASSCGDRECDRQSGRGGAVEVHRLINPRFIHGGEGQGLGPFSNYLHVKGLIGRSGEMTVSRLLQRHADEARADRIKFAA